MSKNVFANGKEISAKKNDNKSVAATPDTCLSPPTPPAGPQPLPYPNTAEASDTTDGSKTVKIGGAEVGLKNASSYKKSTGDEAATKSLGMGVISHNIQGKMKHAAWSMDVMIEGHNAIRHMDLTTHNHSNMGQVPGKDGAKEISDDESDCQKLAEKNEAVVKKAKENREATNKAAEKKRKENEEKKAKESPEDKQKREAKNEKARKNKEDKLSPEKKKELDEKRAKREANKAANAGKPKEENGEPGFAITTAKIKGSGDPKLDGFRNAASNETMKVDGADDSFQQDCAAKDEKIPDCSGQPEEREWGDGRTHSEARLLNPLMKKAKAALPAKSGISITMKVYHEFDAVPGEGDGLPCHLCRKVICRAQQCGINITLCDKDNKPVNAADLCKDGEPLPAGEKADSDTRNKTWGDKFGGHESWKKAKEIADASRKAAAEAAKTAKAAAEAASKLASAVPK